MNRLDIQEFESKFYWSMMLNGNVYTGSSDSFHGAIQQARIFLPFHRIMIEQGRGVKQNGRWHIMRQSHGVAQHAIVGNIKDLAKVWL